MVSRFRSVALAGASVAVLSLVAGTALAQTGGVRTGPTSGAIRPDAQTYRFDPGQAHSPRNETVLTRPRPELDPLGVRAGAFRIFPQIVVGGEYTDNLFYTNANKQDDFVARFQPNVFIGSDWSNHMLNFRASADVGRYADNSSEDFVDWNVGIDGRVDISRATNIFAMASYSQLHEGRDSPQATANQAEPVRYDVGTVSGGVRHSFGRVSVLAEGEATRFDFGNVPGRAGGIIDQGDRDRDIYQIGTKLAYEIIPQYSAFIRARYQWREYDRTFDAAGFQRSSKGYEIVAGTDIDITGVMFGSVFAGYRQQDYDDARFPKIDGFTYGGDLTWNVTTLTSMNLRVARDVNEQTVAGAAGSFGTSAAFTVDHELMRNLLLLGRLTYFHDDFEGIDRKDQTWAFRTGGQYRLNRHLWASAEYQFTTLSSSGAAARPKYNENRFMLRLSTQI